MSAAPTKRPVATPRPKAKEEESTAEELLLEGMRLSLVLKLVEGSK